MAEEEAQSSRETRPSKLAFVKHRVVEGHSFIDTSFESEATPMAVDACTNESHMVSFVAKDLNERVRLTSPPMSGDSVGRDSFTATTSSSSSPSPYPPLVPDAQVLLDLENEAKHISLHLGRVMQELSGSVKGMTGLTCEFVNNYSETINATCDTVDACIKNMYQLMAKTEELLQVLRPVPKLAQQIREIRRMLDLFESHLQKTVS